MKILDAKKIVEKIKKEIIISATTFDGLTLNIVQVGNNESCSRYVAIKKKLGKQFGINVVVNYFKQASDEQLLQLINNLNNSIDCNGIIVQLPLPRENDAKKIIEAIHETKDVDCLKYSTLKHFSGEGFFPPVVNAIKSTLDAYEISLENKTVLLIGKGMSAGWPIMMWLLDKPITFIVCDVHEKDFSRFFQLSDIVISAVGKNKFIDPKKLAPNNYFLDVGTSITDGVIHGDLNVDNISGSLFQGYTPTPGGIGALTAVFLMQNLLFLVRKQNFAK